MDNATATETHPTNNPHAAARRAVRILRDKFPRLRRTGSTAIVHTGSGATVFGCLCGATHTAWTWYRDARHVREWEHAHAGCAVALLRDLERLRLRSAARCYGRGGRCYFPYLERADERSDDAEVRS